MLASQQSYSNIINAINQNEHYHIPKYQRAFSWKLENWEKLFDDISENDAGYFIGSIICVKNDFNAQPGFDIIYELIDGQQRMTTLTILMAAIYKKMGELLHGNPDFMLD